MSTSPVRWSLVGVGRAGLARARAILDDPASHLACTWRGRNAERLPATPHALSLEEAIAEADAVAICSPDAAHPAQVRAALEAGRHVVCEYPVAPEPREAQALLDLALERDLVLHVEHIELLSAPQAMLRGHVRSDRVVELEQEFTRSGDESVAPEQVVARNLARIHRMIDLAGPVLEVGPLTLQPGHVSGILHHARGATSRFQWSQSPYDSRHTRMTVHTVGGDRWTLTADTLRRGDMPQTLIEADPLFHQDHRRAMARILEQAPPYLHDGRIVHGLQVLRRIAEGREGRVGTR